MLGCRPNSDVTASRISFLTDTLQCLCMGKEVWGPPHPIPTRECHGRGNFPLPQPPLPPSLKGTCRTFTTQSTTSWLPTRHESISSYDDISCRRAKRDAQVSFTAEIWERGIEGDNEAYDGVTSSLGSKPEVPYHGRFLVGWATARIMADYASTA